MSTFAVIAALIWWRPPRPIAQSLPAEHFVSAIRGGLRYARYNPDLRATLIRAAGFFPLASVYWALLPLLVRAQIAGATVFTQLVGGFLVATGFFAWLGALLLAGFTVAATVIGHRFWLRRGAEFRHELTTSLEHLAIVGGLLLLSALDFNPAG